jgi:hypothetical protein
VASRTRIDYHRAMHKGAGFPSTARNTLIAIASVSALALFLPAALAQTATPEKPAEFKGMQTPGSPAPLTTAPLTTAPGANLITPSTGPINPQPGFTGGKMVMTQAVWRDYVRYLQNDVAIGYGFFMITVDGSASDVRQCKNYTCQINPITQSTALSDCKTKLRNRRCVIFAEGRTIKYGYQVVP